MFYLHGQFLGKIDRERSFNYPFHCIQHDNYLIVLDRGDRSVKCFDTDRR